jgi:serine/threonine protein kinase
MCGTFAVKRLKTERRADFVAEVTVLRKLTTVHAHQHLVTLFATYELSGELRPFHLIFPWAEADLFHLWKRCPSPRRCPEMENWISEQCIGLMAALQQLHRYWTFSTSSVFALIGSTDSNITNLTSSAEDGQRPHQSRRIFGRHGDIKPDNILWFPNSSSPGEPYQGILKIADFGSTRFNTQNHWSDAQNGSVPNSPTYRSPEYEISGECTTLCDVWALGCVYLECVTWYFGGYALFESFARKRLAHDERLGMPSDTFFTIEKRNGRKVASVKRPVVEVSVCSPIESFSHLH